MSTLTANAAPVKLLTMFIGVNALRTAFKAVAKVAGPAILESPKSRTFLRCSEGRAWIGATSGPVALLAKLTGTQLDADADVVHDYPFSRLKRVADAVTCDYLDVTFSADNSVLELAALRQKGGINATFKLATTPDVNAPGVPAFRPFDRDMAWQAPAPDLLRALDQCIPSIGKSSRHNTDGVFVQCGDDSITLVATDGAKLSRSSVGANDGLRPDKSRMIPSEAIKAVAAFLKSCGEGLASFAFEEDEASKANTYTGRHFLRFRSSDMDLRVRLDEHASLPKFSEEDVFPTERVASVEFHDVKALLQAVKVAAKDGSVTLSHDASNGQVLVADDCGNSTEVVTAPEYRSGESFVRSFDGKALSAFLRSNAKAACLKLSVAPLKERKADFRADGSGGYFDHFGPCRITSDTGAEFAIQPITVKATGPAPTPVAAPEPVVIASVEPEPVAAPIATPEPEPVVIPSLPSWVKHVRVNSCGRVTDYKFDGSVWMPSGNQHAYYMAMERTDRLEQYMAMGALTIVTPEPVAELIPMPEPVAETSVIVRSAAMATEPTDDVKPLTPVKPKRARKPKVAKVETPPVETIATPVADLKPGDRITGPGGTFTVESVGKSWDGSAAIYVAERPTNAPLRCSVGGSVPVVKVETPVTPVPNFSADEVITPSAIFGQDTPVAVFGADRAPTPDDLGQLVYDVVEHVKPGASTSDRPGSWLVATFADEDTARDFARSASENCRASGVCFEVQAHPELSPDRCGSLVDAIREERKAIDPESLILGAIDSYRSKVNAIDGHSAAGATWDALTPDDRARVTGHMLERRYIAPDDMDSYEPAALFRSFIVGCTEGETSMELLEASAKATREARFWGEVYHAMDDVIAEVLAEMIPTDPRPDFSGTEAPAPLSGGSPDAEAPEMVIAWTLPERQGWAARLSETAHPTTGPRMVERVTEELRERIAPIVRTYRECGDMKGAAWNGWLAWKAMGSDEEQDFAAWCDAIHYVPGGQDDLDGDEAWDEFVRECIVGTPVAFPEPSGPGPDGRRSDIDLAAFIVATETIGSSYAVHRFPGGFELRALDLAPLVIVYTALGQPWHRIDTASIILPTSTDTPVRVSRDATPTPSRSFPEAAPLTIEIKGRPYGLQRVEQGFDLTKPSGESYRVSPGLLAWECECPSFGFNCRGIHGAKCKHVAALEAAGLIRPTTPADDDRRDIDTREGKTMDDDIAIERNARDMAEGDPQFETPEGYFDVNGMPRPICGGSEGPTDSLPWIYRPNYRERGDSWEVMDAEGITIAICNDYHLGKGDNERHAMLFAAAPELLAALKAIEAYWRDGNFSRDQDLWEAANYAIKKATLR